MRRRRPLLRSAAVGGAAYYAGKKVAGRQDPDPAGGDADAAADSPTDAGEHARPSSGISPEVLDELKQLSVLKEEGVLTQDEFQAEKQKLLGL